MATKSGSKMFWIVSGLIVVAGSVGAYFLFRKPKEEKGTGDTDTNTDEKQITETIFGSDKKTYTAPSELNSIDKIKSFQDWMDAQGKGWINKNAKWVLLNKGAGYGNYGKSTDAVWKVYGKDYLKSLNDTKVNVNKDKPSSSDINIVIQNATGNKADKSVLEGKPASYVKDWATAIKNKRKTFYWGNKTYRVKTGDVLLDFVPVGKTFYASKTGSYSKETASNDASAMEIKKGNLMGKAGDTSFDGKHTFIYFPDKIGNKWIYASALTTTKPSSSFIGGEMDLDMFSSFDNNLDLNL